MGRHIIDSAIDDINEALGDIEKAQHFETMVVGYVMQLKNSIVWGTINQEEAFLALAAFANAEAGTEINTDPQLFTTNDEITRTSEL